MYQSVPYLDLDIVDVCILNKTKKVDRWSIVSL